MYFTNPLYSSINHIAMLNSFLPKAGVIKCFNTKGFNTQAYKNMQNQIASGHPRAFDQNLITDRLNLSKTDARIFAIAFRDMKK